MGDKSSLGPLLLGAAITGATGLCLYLLLKNEEKLCENQNLTCQMTVLDVRISKENVGIVLGRHGANIREIQSKTNTRIYVKDHLETDQYKVLSISGYPDGIKLADILIQQTILSQPRMESQIVHIPQSAAISVLGRHDEHIKSIEEKSRCRLYVEKNCEDCPGQIKITLQGPRDQIVKAQGIIQTGLETNQNIFNQTDRPARLKYQQPLFLKYDPEEDDNLISSGTISQEQLRSTGSDQLIQVYVSCISTPAMFWVQNVGPSSIDLDKLTQEMTSYYSKQENQVFHKLERVDVGDIVVSSFAGDNSYYRAKVVEIHVNEYDYLQSTVDLDFVDFGDAEVKSISEVFELRTNYLKLRFQAIPCRLANIRPIGSDSSWSE
ncbi:tudor and KH domain-containing protein homolog, partial [Eurytemora carolleeae]|uniref:tudor and KH domain-containing protein homolog n=1 Tax=Eurytemora carolleeae TaxID=1294199 RepID=UPI000C76DBA5